MKLKAGTIKRIHVNRQALQQGRVDPITIQTSKGAIPASSVEWDGPTKMVYSPDKPLSSGAKLWVETRAEVEAH